MSAFAAVHGAIIVIWADKTVQHQRSTLPYKQNTWQNLKFRDFPSTKISRQQSVMFVAHILCKDAIASWAWPILWTQNTVHLGRAWVSFVVWARLNCLELKIHRIKLQSHSNVFTSNGFLSFHLGSRVAVVLWSFDVSAVALGQSKPVEVSASWSLKSYLQST